MGKAGRFACILTPMLCTLASLVCTVLVLVGGTNKSSTLASNLYFFSIDTRNLTLSENVDLPTSFFDNSVKTGFGNLTAKDLNLADFYTSSLWNYCSGTIDANDKWTVADCGKPSATYSFDLIQILNASMTADELDFPDSVQKVNKAVGAASKVMAAMYVLGLVTGVVTFAVGWFGLLSRWGSCVTTILADVSFFFLLVGSIISTALYYTMRTVYDKAFSQFNLVAATGNNMFTLTWLAVAFALAASVFWMFSTCCCSGKRDRVMRTDHGKTKGSGGHKYERVAAPYVGGSGSALPMSSVGKQQAAGFEPYRHA
ncbi:uncharacterized protein H6S33_011764 [Morchella sextelata]|uniref:uncharacterized protein n=1 Tax=Morchella sextelata TaxID=1174677 RepID=UPI001D039A20|nr:uncharacterized protein H6S33_011764 [Morchella sextelata]KAH0610237.1 hypothetical protein H6S33_011764 [Morchella sextelata]